VGGSTLCFSVRFSVLAGTPDDVSLISFDLALDKFLMFESGVSVTTLGLFSFCGDLDLDLLRRIFFFSLPASAGGPLFGVGMGVPSTTSGFALDVSPSLAEGLRNRSSARPGGGETTSGPLFATFPIFSTGSSVG